jgi:UPF0271 protein
VKVDINCDLGEGTTYADDERDAALLSLVTSANIACGLHAGDPSRIARTVRAAHERGVALGAHVSYDDRENFGRLVVERQREELTSDLLYQLGAISAIAEAQGARVTYVKPHGALYNQIVHDESHAGAVIDAIAAFNPALKLLTLPGAVVALHAAEKGITVVEEGFADRGYHRNGTLVARNLPGAVLTDPSLVARRGREIVCDRRVTTIEGESVSINVDSLCIHSDTPGAVELALSLRRELLEHHVTIAPFTDQGIS